MGRSRQFNEDEVLEAAQNAFWSKGYEATSTRDLTEAMGITPASLYNAFGDKRHLYLRALDHYLDRSLRERIRRMETTKSPHAAIPAFFAETIERSIADSEHRGCMLVNSALESRPDDPEVQRVIAAESEAFEAFFRRCLNAAAANGEIELRQPAEDLARLLLSTSFGLRVLARIRPDRALLEGVVRPVMAMIGLPPLEERTER
ncbi:TetR/AcrR family transcriptional regulator [Rhizobium sp. BK251]|uniref:TetR/AcrR family transcriptional regulator n=1 Tax=Rhizobium sp. BK251 TaxID=2512125 RepID=UPI001046B176|nr:TetR/AcrR family transcriptional regulator [Rhizobium sp. BK251]TCL71823.1 TetR family transcriptional regulator [Rhizobium sp. BK251]